MNEVPGEEPPHDGTAGPGGAGVYPPPYATPAGSQAGGSDDELAAALAAQTAMYTGPITIPVVNSDPSFRPDPAEVHAELPPPFPVPPPPPAPEYVAPDAVASDPEPSVFAVPASATHAPPPQAPAPIPAPGLVPAPDDSPTGSSALPDDELSRTVEQEAAAGSTLDAILLLENELRRRQGLEPVVDTVVPPAGVGAAFGAELWNDADPAGGAVPGWTEAPDPAREGMAAAAFAQPLPPAPEDAVERETPHAEPAASVDPGPVPGEPGEPEASAQDAWLTAPPPTFVPPPLVEPPAPGPVDPTALTPSPVSGLPAPAPATLVEGPDAPVDVSLLPPPPAATAVDAPGPVIAGIPGPDAPMPLPPPANGEAYVVPHSAGDPEVEGIDDIDRADVAAPIAVDEAGVASVAPVPVSTATMVAVGGPVEPPRVVDPSAFVVEAVALEPTPAEQRAGHAARLFWLWFAANSSIVMIAVSATLFTAGMSLRQVLVAIVAGVGLSALPLGLGSLAGKWSGQPTMVVSRATFGRLGNILPALLAVLGRVLWGGVLLWLLATTVRAVLAPSEPDAGVTAFVALAAGAVLAGIVAVLGYGLLHRVQRVLGILSTLLVLATIVATASHVDIPAALRTDDGPWTLAIGGTVLVFSVVGLAWAQSSSDLARYQKSAGSGAANMLWGSFGVIVPTLAILAWGAILAASSPALATGLARAPLATLAGLVPDGVALPLLAAAGFGLVAGAIVTMYSGGLALVAVGVRLPRAIATLAAAVLVALVAAGLLMLSGDAQTIVTDVATTAAVPIAAWAGIFASEMMIRLRRFHAPSLLAPGGIYPPVRWVNLVGLVVITVLGFGFVTAELAGLNWTGYLFPVLGIGADTPLAGTDIGVLFALGLGLLLPLVTGVPAIRRQERAGAAPGGEPAAAPLVD